MTSTPILSRINFICGIFGCVIGALLLPVVFNTALAIGNLSGEEERLLRNASIVVLALSAILILFKHKIRSAAPSLLFFSLLLLAGMEFTVRAAVRLFASDETKQNLLMQAEMSRGMSMVYEGHPFTQFTGKTGSALKGTATFGNLQPYNNFGFPDVDFEYEKPENVIRIACIGESTTADGYPVYLENSLNENRLQQNTCYETMCFAQPMWTTEHTMISFLTSVVDFKPDYLIIHHGWNEGKVRNCLPGQFRNDYSHHFKSFEKPEIYDGAFIRASIIYRWLKFQFNKTPAWMSMGSAIEKERAYTALNFSDSTELKPYRRNLETIITMAKFYNIKVVMTTLPHSTDSTIEFYYSLPNIEQCNTINRELADKYKSEILFADIDAEMTGKENALFNDLGHTEPEGLKMKAEIIAPVILADAQKIEEHIASLSSLKCKEVRLHRIQQRMVFKKSSLSSDKQLEQKVLDFYTSDSLKRASRIK